MTHAQRLASFVLRSSYHDLSGSARSRLKVHVLDTIGCAIGAVGAKPIRAVRRQIAELGGRPQCTLIGGGRSSVDRVAFFNSALVRYLDFMDNFLARGETCHPSDNFGALLAVGEYAQRSGEELLTALAIAYQVQCRLTEAAPIMSQGFDHTTQLSYSIAAGASKLLRLGRNKTTSALGIAGASCVQLAVIRAEPVSQWKGFASADCAASTVHSALLARAGITGPVEIFEGPKGFMEALEEEFEIDWSNQGLDVIGRALIKRYNAEAHSQSALEGVIELRERHRLRGNDVRSIRIDTFRTAYDIIGGGAFGPKDSPRIKEQADHNLQYLAAVALLDGDAGPRQFTPARIRRRDVQTLLRKVTVKPSRLYTWRYPEEMGCKVTIRLKNGQKLSITKSKYEGFFSQPMSWERVVEKFERLAIAHTTAALRRQIIETVDDLERLRVSDLTRLLARVKA